MLLGNISPSFLRRDRLISSILRVMLKYNPASRMMGLVVMIQKVFVGRDKCWYSCIKLDKICKLVDLMISRSLPEVVWILLYNFMQVQPSQCLLILLLFSSQECTIQHKKYLTPLPLVHESNLDRQWQDSNNFGSSQNLVSDTKAAKTNTSDGTVHIT